MRLGPCPAGSSALWPAASCACPHEQRGPGALLAHTGGNPRRMVLAFWASVLTCCPHHTKGPRLRMCAWAGVPLRVLGRAAAHTCRTIQQSACRGDHWRGLRNAWSPVFFSGTLASPPVRFGDRSGRHDDCAAHLHTPSRQQPPAQLRSPSKLAATRSITWATRQQAAASTS